MKWYTCIWTPGKAEDAEYRQYQKIEREAIRQRRQEEADEAEAIRIQQAELERFRAEENRIKKMAALASKDEQLARRLAELEEAENEADLHDESLAIELAEREREVARLKKVTLLDMTNFSILDYRCH